MCLKLTLYITTLQVRNCSKLRGEYELNKNSSAEYTVIDCYIKGSIGNIFKFITSTNNVKTNDAEMLKMNSSSQFLQNKCIT